MDNSNSSSNEKCSSSPCHSDQLKCNEGNLTSINTNQYDQQQLATTHSANSTVTTTTAITNKPLHTNNTNNNNNYSSSTQDTTSLANADTGATGHFMAISDLPYLINITPVAQPLTVTLPDGSTMQSTHTAELNFPQIPPTARTCHVFPALAATGSLLSIGKLCDSGCQAIYDKDSVRIFHDGHIVLQGHRSPASRLWMIQLHQEIPTSLESASTAVHNQSLTKTITFLLAALGQSSNLHRS
jgi:hypothetical protein